MQRIRSLLHVTTISLPHALVGLRTTVLRRSLHLGSETIAKCDREVGIRKNHRVCTDGGESASGTRILSVFIACKKTLRFVVQIREGYSVETRVAVSPAFPGFWPGRWSNEGVAGCRRGP